jgi:hypothetical protein
MATRAPKLATVEDEIHSRDEEARALNIAQRIAAVMGEVDYVQKERKNGMNYSIVSHDAVTAKVRPLLHKHGVIYYPRGLTVSQNGNRTEAVFTVRFENIDNRSDYIDVETFGYGVDPQDKGPGKAMSYGVKYALLKVLGLETDLPGWWFANHADCPPDFTPRWKRSSDERVRHAPIGTLAAIRDSPPQVSNRSRLPAAVHQSRSRVAGIGPSRFDRRSAGEERLMLPQRIPKPKKRATRWRSQAHCNFVRSHGCSVAACHGVPIEVAHVRNGSGAGMGQKPDDWRTASLCRYHHAEQHRSAKISSGGMSRVVTLRC